MTLYCAKCHQPLPVHHFPGAIPEWQAVFTWRGGERVCVDACRPLNLPSQEDGS